ncbi:MAG TPA: hypothetical protein VMU59_11480 [Caulobacteraceae bacterium]|nr:hypothetical protein [Caulobacteraceae bacterium]
MVGLTSGRNTAFRSGENYGRPIAAGVVIQVGALVALNAAGFLVPASAASALFVDGRAERHYDNTNGVDGADSMQVRRGVFRYDNAAGVDAFTAHDIGKGCWALDDHTVGKFNGGGVRPFAGTIVDLDEVGVWVDVAVSPPAPKTVRLYFAINQTDLLAGTSAELIAPVNGNISRIVTTNQVAVTTGGALTVDVGATPVAGLSVAIANGSAKGTINSDVPTEGDATTAVAIDQRIQVIPAGFAAAGAVSGYVEITY